jgi:hypothetical protein
VQYFDFNLYFFSYDGGTLYELLVRSSGKKTPRLDDERNSGRDMADTQNNLVDLQPSSFGFR